MNTETGQLANESMKMILDSYMEFIDIMEKTLKKCTMPTMLRVLSSSLIAQRRKDWKPVLEFINKNEQKGEKNEKTDMDGKLD